MGSYSIGGKEIFKDPFKIFNDWLQEATDNPLIVNPNAMNLATVSKQGIPSARFLLLKDVTENGFCFFTNFDSKKARELAENPHAAITFFWEPLKRQVKIMGKVEKVSEEDSIKAFNKRPVELQLNVLASPQSSVIASCDVFQERYDILKKQYEGKIIPKPENWGGFLLKPEMFEFYELCEFYLDDRIQFRRRKLGEEIDPTLTQEGENGWVYERLAP